MAEFITFLAGLPLLYLIGDFYCRLGVWLWRTLAQAMRPVIAASGDAGVTEIAAVQDDSRYAAALNGASALIHELATRPDMTPPEKLSTVTFTILHAMREVEEQPYRPGKEPGVTPCIVTSGRPTAGRTRRRFASPGGAGL